MDLQPEDFLSKWTCNICRISPSVLEASHLETQYLLNDHRLLITKDFELCMKCYFCGTVYHATCLCETSKTSLNSVVMTSTTWMCHSCTPE